MYVHINGYTCTRIQRMTEGFISVLLLLPYHIPTRDLYPQCFAIIIYDLPASFSLHLRAAARAADVSRMDQYSLSTDDQTHFARAEGNFFLFPFPSRSFWYLEEKKLTNFLISYLRKLI